MRLKHLFTGGLSWRELRVFIAGLPMESATQTARRDAAPAVAEVDEEAPLGSWSKVELLLASVIDLLQNLIYVQVSRAGVQSPPPVPVRRPGVERISQSRKASPAQVAYLNEIRARNAARGA